jgi:glycosyltransferase involved in cell wall biosynthesis
VKTEINNINVLIIIPCFNEEASIYKLLLEIKGVKIPNVILHALPVNDCSTDKTTNEIERATSVYLDLTVNLGIGGAVQSGYHFAQLHQYDIAVQLDGDGQHPVSELSKLLTPLIQNECDVVIGSRFIHKEGFQSSSLRRFGINYFKRLNQFLLGIKITDSTSGYRAINTKALKLVCDYYPDEYPEPEAIILFHMNGLKIREVPVEMKERQGGVSSISSFRSLYYMIKVTLGILFIYFRIKFYGKRSTL